MRFHEPTDFFSRKNPDPYLINGKQYVETTVDIRSVEEYPHSYSPFYIGKSKRFAELKAESHMFYSDAMFIEERDKYLAAYNEAVKGISRQSSNAARFEFWTEDMWNVFIKHFFGEHYVWVASANGRNIATGYDYYVFMVVDSNG